ncbi:hypothetical protein [Pseudoalteromonas haloplanktis]|uniref:hypothetical protein n=1 Tax=Pseudoalteromonas haloplanktis TaxID=228 RepID=UPI0021D4C0F7|nr:hypothetical protein [Pseudoalteromonas haloplanktis]
MPVYALKPALKLIFYKGSYLEPFSIISSLYAIIKSWPKACSSLIKFLNNLQSGSFLPQAIKVCRCNESLCQIPLAKLVI